MIVEAKNINFSYQKNGRQILNDVSLSLEEGEVMSILGPNGAGKSTLLNLIATLLTPDIRFVRLIFPSDTCRTYTESKEPDTSTERETSVDVRQCDRRTQDDALGLFYEALCG